MERGQQIRRLRQPRILQELYQFVNQASMIVDPYSTRTTDVQEQIDWLREAYIDAKQAVDNGVDEEAEIKKVYDALIDKLYKAL